MNIRYPKPLSPGDWIAVTAPSSGVAAPMHPRLDRALAALRQRGYRVVEGEYLRQQTKQASATPQQRAKEWMRFLADPDVAAIMPPWGGERAIELLPLIDFEALKGLPAKWCVGFSDLSTLHLALTTLSGWATVHGPNLMELGAADVDPVTAAVWNVLSAPSGSTIAQGAAKAFQRTGPDRISQPEAGFLLTEPVQWKRLDGSTAPLRLSGRLIGGCLDTVARLAGTAYGNVPAFIQASQVDGTLLYIEDAEMHPCELLRALCSLRLHGWFNGLTGILVGRSAAADAQNAANLTYADALHAAFAGLPCPVLYDLDIGHLPPQLSLVNGAVAQVEFQDGGGTLVQRLGS